MRVSEFDKIELEVEGKFIGLIIMRHFFDLLYSDIILERRKNICKIQFKQLLTIRQIPVCKKNNNL